MQGHMELLQVEVVTGRAKTAPSLSVMTKEEPSEDGWEVEEDGNGGSRRRADRPVSSVILHLHKTQINTTMDLNIRENNQNNNMVDNM